MERIEEALVVPDGAGALADLYERYVGRMVALATLLTGDRDAAQDIVHDRFVRVASRLSMLRHDAPFEPYLRRAVVNACRTRARRAGVERAWLARAPRAEAIEHPDPTEHDEVWRAIATLPYRQRAAIVLRYFEDLSEEQAARTLGCSPRAVNALVSRAMVSLREMLGEEER